MEILCLLCCASIRISDDDDYDDDGDEEDEDEDVDEYDDDDGRDTSVILLSCDVYTWIFSYAADFYY